MMLPITNQELGLAIKDCLADLRRLQALAVPHDLLYFDTVANTAERAERLLLEMDARFRAHHAPTDVLAMIAHSAMAMNTLRISMSEERAAAIAAEAIEQARTATKH